MTNYEKLALFPLQSVLFPYVSMPLHIFEERYKTMVSRCLADDALFGIVLVEPNALTSPADSIVLHTTGTLARIEQAEPLPNGRYNISIRGESRFALQEVYQDEPYLTARVRPVWDKSNDPIDVQPLFDAAGKLLEEYISVVYSTVQLSGLQLPQDALFLSYAIAATLQVALPDKQRLLAADSALSRLELGIEFLQRELSKINTASDERSDSIERQVDMERTISRLDSSYSHQYFSRS